MIKPLGDYVLVEIIKEADFGVLTAEDGKKKNDSQKGKVLDVGPGTLDLRWGNRTDMFVSKGDIVVWERYANADFTFTENKKDYALVDIKQIMGRE